jgi:hypothetical protein
LKIATIVKMGFRVFDNVTFQICGETNKIYAKIEGCRVMETRFRLRYCVKRYEDGKDINIRNKSNENPLHIMY